MFRRNKGPTATELNIPAYTNWQEFAPDDSEPNDGDDSVHAAEWEQFIDPALVERHKAETK